MLSDGNTTDELHMHDDMVWQCPLAVTVVNNVYRVCQKFLTNFDAL